MFKYIINSYCDIMISVHKNIKDMINPKLEHYLLSMTDIDAFKFIHNYKKKVIVLFPTRNERHQLYKLLKSKYSPYKPIKVYSYGKENNDTRKKFVIKKK